MANNKNCDSCYSCDSCDSCYSCDFCYSCYSCDSCDFCYSCDSCDFCYSCYSCDSCYSCYSCDSCYSCKGLRMSERMIFCLGDGRLKRSGEGYQKNLRIFNQDVSEDEYNKTLTSLRENEVKISLTKWVEEDDMTKDDKDNYSNYKTLGGCLKVFNYEDAWKTWWNNASQDQKNAILDIPQFNSKIFKGITGIDATNKSLSGKEVSVTIDGDTYTAVVK